VRDGRVTTKRELGERKRRPCSIVRYSSVLERRAEGSKKLFTGSEEWLSKYVGFHTVAAS
jgi:hypothetical protein